MSEEELTEWEHRPDVIRVLTCYEMGAWLHRRDCRLMKEIRQQIDDRRERLKPLSSDDWYAGKIRGYDCTIEIISERIGESEG